MKPGLLGFPLITLSATEPILLPASLRRCRRIERNDVFDVAIIGEHTGGG
jgi:hypothetical protein